MFRIGKLPRTFSLSELNTKYGDIYEVIDKTDTASFDGWFKGNIKGKTYWKWFLGVTLIFPDLSI